MHGLVRILDAENPAWRDDSFVTVDGSYTHTKSDALKAMAALRVPYMVMGPYGFDGAASKYLIM